MGELLLTKEMFKFEYLLQLSANKMSKVILYILILIIVGVCLYVVPEKYKEEVAIIASAASIVGVVISICEVVGLKTKTEVVTQSLNKARSDIEKFLTFSEFNELSKQIDEIEAYLRNNSLELVLIKQKELKDKLCVLRGYLKRTSLENDFEQKLNLYIKSIGIDVQTIHNAITQSSPIDSSVVNKNLEFIKELLNEMSGLIKSDKI